MKKFFMIAVLLWGLPLLAQSSTGELRLTVTDSAGLGLKSAVELVSEGNEYRHTLETDDMGKLEVKRLPYGIYEIHIQIEGFAPATEAVEIRSAVPESVVIALKVASLSTSVTVHESGTLIDPYRAGSVNEVGSQMIEDRVTSLPGRSLQDLVNTQPGWLYEGSGVLHPRGSEYQTQFVVDGIPLTDNRSAGFGPEIEADDVDSLKVYTAGIPAEFGRKMGGVIEVDTLRNAQPGLHGQVALSGGSYETAGAYSQLQYSWKQNTLGISGDGNRTDHYLNPVVPANYTNKGTTGSVALSFERDLSAKDRITLNVRHAISRFEIPNEQVQQNGGLISNADGSGSVFIPGGQRQDADNFETMGSISYQHIFSSNAIGWLRGMVRDHSNDLNSNLASWPIRAFQHNDFKEVYFNGSADVHAGRHEWKAGVESDAMFLHENFSDVIPHCQSSQDPQCPITLGIFDPGTPASFAFSGSRPSLEQSAYVQDAMRLGNWTVNAGLRWDHYQLVVNQNAVSPRVSVSHYFGSSGVVVHASYDRVFQTPSFENILLSSSPQVQSLSPSVLRLPVEPSHGDYYEAGVTKGFSEKLRVDANYFRRSVNNFADDDQILNTAVAFPIAFRKAIIYGAEAKVEVPKWGRFSGSVSYSYAVGNAWFPVTGGLFLGQSVASASTQLTGHFPDTQDQRNTVRARVRYQITSRVWMAVGGEYNSGLPFDFQGTPQNALAEYGQGVLNHLDFARGRIKPLLTENASVGAELYRREGRSVRLQADCQNLSNTLDVLDFGGLFSGNAIAPSRSYSVRLVTKF
jgi:hypothetical protein